MIAALATSACEGGGIGRVGSPAWELSTTQEQKVAYYKSACSSYGYKDGTDQMAACIQSEANNASQTASARAASIGQQMNEMGQQRPTMLSTSCHTYSGGMSCTTH